MSSLTTQVLEGVVGAERGGELGLHNMTTTSSRHVMVPGVACTTAPPVGTDAPTLKQEAAQHLATMMGPTRAAVTVRLLEQPGGLHAAAPPPKRPRPCELVKVESLQAFEEPQAACPFCTGETKPAPGQKTRRRRKKKVGRQEVRLGRWWQKFGYSGQAYCLRCSEVFRDHLMRQIPNSAKCSRDSPCTECAGVLAGFVPRAGAGLWAKFDARKDARKPPAQRIPISRPLEAQAEVGAAEVSHVQIRPPVRTLLPSRLVFHTLHTVVGLLQNAAPAWTEHESVVDGVWKAGLA